MADQLAPRNDSHVGRHLSEVAVVHGEVLVDAGVQGHVLAGVVLVHSHPGAVNEEHDAPASRLCEGLKRGGHLAEHYRWAWEVEEEDQWGGHLAEH